MRLLSSSILVSLVLSCASAFGDLTFYGVRFPSAGPKTSGVIRSSLPDFPWLSARSVRTNADVERIINPGGLEENQSGASVKPAIVYLSKQRAQVGQANLNQSDAHYFLQEDVTTRVKKYRWYWTDLNSALGRLLLAKYGLKSVTTLFIFEADGSLLHAEAPISGPESVARAMRMIEYKRRMAEALRADLPELREEFKAGNVKVLVKYLQHADKHATYASEWTAQKLAAMRRAVDHSADLKIKEALALAADGKRREALAMLTDIRREYKPLQASKRAEEAAKEVRRERS